MGICEDSQDFGKGFVMIHRDLQDWERIHEDL